jgi:hypothetical protein
MYRTTLRSSSVLYTLALTLFIFSATISYSQTPSIANVNYGSWTKIAQASGDGWMHFPHGISFDVNNGGNIVKKAIVSWQTSADVVTFAYSRGWMGSLNAGVTWNSPSVTNTTSIDMNTIHRRHDGVLITLPFYPANFNGANPKDTFSFSYDTSTNNGATWGNATYGFVSGFPTLLGGFRFHRGIVEDADGTMYAPAYGQFAAAGGGYETHRVMLLKSTNKGATWTYLSTVQFTASISYNEATIVRCRDGSILCIMRNGSNPLKYRRSTDNGVTWGGAVTTVPGLPANAGVDPYLYMMPNGVLALTYGDNVTGNMRHCYMAYAPDGVGNNWVNVTQTYASTLGGGPGTKSSGYGTIFPTRINRFLQTSDRALYTYYGSDQHPSPNPFSVWTKQADVVLNYRNRIDLASKYESGDITVTTDLTHIDAAHPEAGIAGAFDGSTDYWSSAFKNGGGSGTFTIDLQSDHVLNAIGVCLANGAPQSATIEYSQNGSSYTNLKTYAAGTKHYTIDYTSFSAITARYIRVTTSGTGITGLNEIRLFSQADTYEDYAQNIVPQGYTALNNEGFWVSEGVSPFPTGYKSLRALYMHDDDGNNKEITKTGFGATTQKTMEFRLRVKTIASGGAIQWRLLSGTTNAFRLRVAPGGAVQWYNGTSYVTLSGASVPMDTWVHIKVTANAATGTGTLSINGGTVYSIGKEATVSTLNGFRFASGGAAATGDAALFDDVSFYDTPSGAREITKPQETLMPVTDGRIRVFPNPVVNGQTTISYSLQKEGPVRIAVYNIKGQQEILLNKRQPAGNYTLPYSTAGKAAGVYIVRVVTGEKVEKVKVIVK